MRKCLFLIAALLSALPVRAQSFDRILAAAAEREAVRNCSAAGAGEVVVCGDRDAETGPPATMPSGKR